MIRGVAGLRRTGTRAPVNTERLVLRLCGPLLAGSVALSCAEDTTVIEGQLGRAIPLASGDPLLVPRLLMKREGCPGSAGGCEVICDDLPSRCPEGACIPIVIDSAASVTALAADDDIITAERGCVEVRSAEDVLSAAPSSESLAAAVARFRFSELPMARVPSDDSVWGWRIGDESNNGHVSGILGGNLLHQMAVRFVHQRNQDYSVTFYREFPGSDVALANQGRAYISLQFPGDLLGKEITDFCAVDDGSCDFLGLQYDQDRVQSLVQPTQMVVDACLTPPPGAVVYDSEQRGCEVTRGPGFSADTYVSPTGRQGAPLCRSTPLVLSDGQKARGGLSASLVVATGIPGMVLFEDSARRFFGELGALPPCAPDQEGSLGGFGLEVPACLDDQESQLYAPGWPVAGSQGAPLTRIRVRSLALLPGLTETSGITPCQRLERRVAGLKAQCDEVLREQVPYARASVCAEAAKTSALVLGEVSVRNAELGPNPTSWIRAYVVPAEHPMAVSIRRDVVPEALQPDGLVGTALLYNTDTILDYTDETPGLRVSCNEPGRGTCLALPSCTVASEDVAASCCHGLPEDLIVEMIGDLGLYGCCSALSEGARRELNCRAKAESSEEPCPESPCE